MTTKTLGQVKFDDNKDIPAGYLISYVKKANPKFTENDGNGTNIKWDLNKNTGSADIVGAGKYEGKVTVTFTLDPEDANRPAEVVTNKTNKSNK